MGMGMGKRGQGRDGRSGMRTYMPHERQTLKINNRKQHHQRLPHISRQSDMQIPRQKTAEGGRSRESGEQSSNAQCARYDRHPRHGRHGCGRGGKRWREKGEEILCEMQVRA